MGKRYLLVAISLPEVGCAIVVSLIFCWGAEKAIESVMLFMTRLITQARTGKHLGIGDSQRHENSTANYVWELLANLCQYSG